MAADAFEAAARARALEATGRDVIHLEIGEPDFDTPRHVSEAAIHALLDEKMTHYPPAPGIAPLRAKAESGGSGSEPPEGRSGHTETIRCVSREATTAQTSVRVGCCRSQWSAQALRIEVMRCVSASVESGSGERG